jgi:hypothetical protein
MDKDSRTKLPAKIFVHASRQQPTARQSSLSCFFKEMYKEATRDLPSDTIMPLAG